MNSRERVLSSIRHKEPDRVAIDLGATPSSGISAIAYNKLKKYLSMNDGHNYVYDVVQQVTQPEDSIIERFGVDVLDIGRTFNTKDEDWHEVALPDGNKAYYPAWFKPVCQADGSFNAYLSDGTLVGKMPTGATFLIRRCFHIRTATQRTTKGCPRLWGRLCGPH